MKRTLSLSQYIYVGRQQGTIFEKFTCICCFVYTNLNIPCTLQSKQSKYKLYIEMYIVNTKGFRWFGFIAFCLSVSSSFTTNAYVAYKIKIILIK